MHYGVVDAGTSGRSLFQDSPAALAEIIQGKRLWSGIYKGNCFVQFRERYDRENGTEDFLLHYRGIRADIVQDCGLKKAFRCVRAASEYNISAIQVGFQTPECFVVDYAYKMSALLCILSEQGLELLLQKAQKFLLDVLVQQKIVRSNAGLSRIERLAPRDSLCGNFQIRIPVHHAGGFAAEFQNHRGEILGGCFHHLFSQGRTAGEENNVPTVL